MPVGICVLAYSSSVTYGHLLDQRWYSISLWRHPGLGLFSEDLYCLAFRYDLACGLLLIALGVVVWIKGVSSYPYLTPGLGWIALLDSFLKVQMSKEAKDFGLRQWNILLLLAVLTAFSSFLLVINGFPGPQATKVLTGCTLLLEGIMNWLTVIFTVKQYRKMTPSRMKKSENGAKRRA